ncbi:hypothetical protein [Qipengyuania sp.]|uniref:hypothetical protein n=1 Tax=Qipengyuania sp. TaxID=2004515 RepID=UPI0035C7DE6D
MKSLSRAAVPGAIFLSLTGQAPPAPSLAEDGGDFCARLAKDIGFEDTKIVDGHTVWKAKTRCQSGSVADS